ncbi:MAG: response regulator [Sediminibacterium sp.]|jgi:CheY-like chemotaxis protein
MLQKVLVVNDNELLLMVASKVISLAKFANQTITATDGEKALEIFNDLIDNNNIAAAPALILLDLNMPGMNGWDFLEIFSSNYAINFPNTKVAILSGSVEMKDMLLLVKYPIIIEYISSPISIELLEVLEQKYYSLQETYN